MSRSTQWTYNMVCFSIFFWCSFRSMLFFIAVKKYTEAYHTICSLCSPTHLESNTIGFFILRFFCDLLWFSKTVLGDNLTGFEKFRGWYRPFHKLGGYVVHPKELRGWYRLFPKQKKGFRNSIGRGLIPYVSWVLGPFGSTGVSFTSAGHFVPRAFLLLDMLSEQSTYACTNT